MSPEALELFKMKEEDVVIIPRSKLKLLSFSGYFEAFYNEYLPNNNGYHRRAYLELEKDLEKHFGIAKYKTYGSFRQMKKIYLNRKNSK